jgi:ribonuclease HII
VKKGNTKLKTEYLIGIDEVGRGPLAGPVAVCVVAIDKKYAGKILKKFSLPAEKIVLTDSKKLSEKARDRIFDIQKYIPEIISSVQYCSAKQIDKNGISNCIKKCIESGLKDLNKKGIHSGNAEVFLDGALRAPSTYTQHTIIRGDSSVPIISLASVIAKVSRDTKMKKLHKKFPEYNFAQNKGYGTKSHIQNIKKYGLSTEHRITFCSKINIA